MRIFELLVFGLLLNGSAFAAAFIQDAVKGQVHASTFVCLTNGIYAAAWFQGSEEGAPDVGIWGSRRIAGTWEEPRLIAKIQDDVPHWNPVLRVADDGRLCLYFKVGRNCADWRTYLTESVDAGKTWSAAKELVAGDCRGGRGPVRNKCLRLPSGRWLAPASREIGRWRAFVDRSDDDGGSWRASAEIGMPTNAPTAGVIQPTLWTDENNVVHAYMRSDSGKIWESRSRDDGETWEEAAPTLLPNNNSSIDIVKSADGMLYLALNPTSGNWASRSTLEIWRSADEGKTWQAWFTLEKAESGEFSYPCIREVRRGVLAVSYTWNRKRIAFREISTEPPRASFGGRDLPVETCRVSAVPMNRIWPGRQRPLSQTKTAYFTSFDVTAAGEFQLRLPAGTENVRVRPFRREQGTVADGIFRTRIERPEQFVVQADGTEIHVFADSPWTYARRDGDRYFGPGEHEVGTIVPKSGERIVIDRGATVYGNIVLLGVTNVTVEGRGILDSSRISRVDASWPGTRAVEACGIPGARTEYGTGPVYACRCGNISISGIVFRDAPQWTMNICDSSDIRVDGVKLVGMWRYNADGIDICACERSVVRNSFIRSFDDCVIARPQLRREEGTPMHDMTVSNCVLWCDWGVNMKVQHGQRPCTMSDLRFRDIDCVHVSWTALTVTTRWGSSDNVIRGVSFDDIRVDAPEDRVRQQFQKSEEECFRAEMATSIILADMGCYSMGTPAANQGKPGKMDPDFFRLTYSDIALRDFTVYDRPGHRLRDDSPQKCVVKISTPLPHFSIRDLDVSGLPPRTRIDAKGDIRFR